MRIAFLGTRGVPARYGGFETAIEEIGQRLAANGHEIVVYCRGAQAPRPGKHLGMDLVHLPAAHRKSLETLTHTALSMGHILATRRSYDAAIVFNAANAPLLPVLRLKQLPVAVHVDGLEWKRAKWGKLGRHYYRAAERLAVQWADALIADAVGIADYYKAEFSVPTELLTYGAPIQRSPAVDRLASVGLTPGSYHLVVARFEPENHVLEIAQGYAASTATLPLVIVGSAPYADDYTQAIAAIAAADRRIQILGGIWDQELLDQLYAHAATYLHGHSVGGTNPSLLRAMGAGTAVIAFDVVFNREVLGDIGGFFADPAELSALLLAAEQDRDRLAEEATALQRRAQLNYCWDDVASGYEDLLSRIVQGQSIRPRTALRAGGRTRRRPSGQGTW